jgi:iron complex outermembrane receptor protein
MMKRIVLACMGLFLVSAAYAQQPEAQKLERIEVTGSAIKRLDVETAVPVQILRRSDIERIGATTTVRYTFR